MAQKNELNVGTGRLGWLADGDPDTPLVATLLEDNGRHITLTVPWPRGEHDSPSERWFGDFILWGDDPDRTRFAYQVPEILWFEDQAGPVTLVGCRSGGSSSRMPLGGGEGVARVTFAVLGARGDYRRINGLRSELPGLGDWIGLSAVTSEVQTDSKGRTTSFEIRAESPDPIVLGRRLNLCVRPNWRTDVGQADTTSVVEALQVETLVSRPRPWEEHLRAHQAVRDLLDVAAWLPTTYSSLFANLATDGHKTMTGREVGPNWAPVRTRSLRGQRDRRPRREYLFRFDDVGVAGFRRWVRLRDRFRRGLDPMLGLLDLEGAQVETAIAQSGLALEAIGYELAQESGLSKKTAGAEHHKARLERIVAALPAGILTVVHDPIDPDDWVKRSSDAYNGVKHANRVVPDVLELLNVERENELIFRLWVATRIGVSPDLLNTTVRRDRQAYQLRPA